MSSFSGFCRLRRAVTALVLASTLGSVGVAMAQAPLTVEQAHAAASAGQVVLIDIRSPQEWRETGVPASAHAITMHQREAAFRARLEAVIGTSKNRPIALICASGNRSRSLIGWFRTAGYSKISDVPAGVSGNGAAKGWKSAGLPLRRWQPGAEAPMTLPAAGVLPPERRTDKAR